MKMRSLGNQGLRVTELGLGCMGLSDFYSSSGVTEAQGIALIHRALDLGVTFLDTADAYGPHTNERTVGKALQGRRDGVVLATKFGIVRESGSADRSINGTPAYVRSACEASLKRLGVDTIDLYYQHRVDLTVPIEDTVGAMADLVRQGKVRYLGLSEAAPSTLRRAHQVHPISALQTEYSLWSRDPEDEVLPTVRELGIGFVPYSPLGRGFLAGRFRTIDDLAQDDWRRQSPRFQGENFAKNLDVVAQIHAIAAEKGCTPSQLALAWLLARGPDIVPIPGTTSVARLEENLAATSITLTKSESERIEAVAPRGVAVGQRYNPAAMPSINGQTPPVGG
ncbi:MAG: Pyridoxine 4-dehydrogenase [Gammaproteobacteria bacterium]|nr:Pyridoxine 4-dehydrogenase [Gammaproteobacteria bacterium]